MLCVESIKANYFSREESVDEEFLAAANRTCAVAANHRFEAPTLPPMNNVPGFEAIHLSTSDIYDLFLLLLMVYIAYREQNKLSRRTEREIELEQKMLEVKNLKDQGKWMLGTSVMAGVMGIAAGVVPIAIRFQGPRIQQLIGMFSTRLGTMKEAKFADSLAQICQSGSKTNEAYGHVMQVKGEGNRKLYEELSAIAGKDGEEILSQMREELEVSNGFIRFLQMLSEMNERTASNLYH